MTAALFLFVSFIRHEILGTGTYCGCCFTHSNFVVVATVFRCFQLFQALPSTPLLSRAELSLYLKLLSDGTVS